MEFTKILLFQNLREDEIAELMERQEISTIQLDKGVYVFLQGEEPEYVYILLEGAVQVESLGADGRRTILNRFSEPGTVFAEVYAYLDHKTYDYSCQVTKKARILRMEKSLLLPRENPDPIAGKLLISMLTILSEKAYYLNQKLMIVGEMTLRAKILKFLQNRANADGVVQLEFNREEMADFLGTTRPSLSRELKNMENEGIAVVGKNAIVLLKS